MSDRQTFTHACACGPLHYTDRAAQRRMQRLVDSLGPFVAVHIAGLGMWRVPRHYIALHGLKAPEVPRLALKFGWEEVGVVG